MGEVSLEVAPPPSDLDLPNFRRIEQGTRVHRVHDSTYPGNAFNRCQGNPARFSPIHDQHGQCVSSLYAASTLDAAFYETVFHNVPTSASTKTVRRQDVLCRSHTIIELARSMELVSLRKPDLLKWNVSRNGLIASDASHYDQTAQWAEAIHNQFPSADGLIWTSNQCDPDDACLFFGTRVTEEDLKVISTRNGLVDQSVLADARAAGQRSNIGITI